MPRSESDVKVNKERVCCKHALFILNKEKYDYKLKEKVLNGGQITREEAILLSNAVDKQALYRAAGEIRDKRVGRRFDTCSIINARSGRCSENCKWCAQSALFKTNIEEYELVDEKTCLDLARSNADYGVDKFRL
mgnify:CR=1 FL=1